MGSESALINKYRPATFSEVLGNTIAVKTLEENVLSQTPSHAFLFSGPSGIGKTTLARIIASNIGASVEEIDAATNNGVDATKMIVDISQYQPLMAPKKLLLIDECHALSKAAWQPLLKLIEEPPDYLTVALCTTEFGKVPETILTRCHHVVLKPCSPNDIDALLSLVCECEGWQPPNDVMNAVIVAATGQPRKALSFLNAAHLCQTREEVSQVVAAVQSESSPMTELLTFLMKGGTSWDRIRPLLEKIEDDESSWIGAGRWLTNALLRSEEAQARQIHRLLDAMTFPRNGFDKKAQFVVAITAYLWNSE